VDVVVRAGPQERSPLGVPGGREMR
jgi:hypothetical protein